MILQKPYDAGSWPVSVQELAEHINVHDLDCTLNSRQILSHLSDYFDRRQIKFPTLLLAALMTGFAVIPKEGGVITRFCKVE